MQAFDAQSGKPVWKTYSIPAPGEPGSDTWKKADTWKTGGASTWMTRQLRSRHQYGLLGHRERFAVVWRSAAGRQSVHVLDARARRRGKPFDMEKWGYERDLKLNLLAT